jgi:hypothetical protein
LPVGALVLALNLACVAALTVLRVTDPFVARDVKRCNGI